MERIIQRTLLLSTLLLGAQANAEQANSTDEKKWSIGVGSYVFSITNEDNTNDDINFSGLSIATGYAVNNNFQIKGTYFSLENDEFSNVKSAGFDLMAYGGVGFSRKGFRGYGGAGFFSDKWSFRNGSDSFSGFQFGGGLGYNWGPAALDFVINLRQVDKYEDFFVNSGNYVAVSGNLSIAYLF